MPLDKSKSKAAFSRNVAEMMDAGHPQDQALAAAYRIKRQRRADGGSVDDAPQINVQPPPPTSANYAQANQTMQLNPQEQALYQRHLTNLNGSGGVDNADGSRSTLYQSVQEHNGKYYNVPTVWDGKIQTEKYTNPQGQTFDVPNQTALQNVDKAGWDSFPSYDTPEAADARYDQMHGYMEKDTSDYMASKGKKRGGSVTAALDIARRVKRRASGGAVHVGPIDSAVPGRTDEHEMNVEEGSYVLPSETISHLGENNTDAGYEVAKKMFPHSSRHVVKLKRAKGGAIPVITAGGEFVVSPRDVKRIGGGDMAHGHKILDAFVMHQRKKHIETLKGLEAPAQD